MTIRIFLEQYNGASHAIEGEPPPAAWLELDDERQRVRIGFDYDRHEHRRLELAIDAELSAKSVIRANERAAFLTNLIEAHRVNTLNAGRDHNNRVRRFKAGSRNHLQAIALLLEQHDTASRDLWRALAPAEGGTENGYRSSAERDFVRELTPDEARELAAMLLHYAGEVEAGR